MTTWNKNTLASLCTLMVFAGATPATRGQWGNFHIARDALGAYVAPVHASLLRDGRVLLNGFAFESQNGGHRYGFSGVFEPTEMNEQEITTATSTFNITRVDESAGDGSLVHSAQVNLPDGQKFFVGGTKEDTTLSPETVAFPTPLPRYGGSIPSKDVGVDVGQVLDINSNGDVSLDAEYLGSGHADYQGNGPLFGAAFNPSALALPDQRVLAIHGFEKCCGFHEKLDISVFDYQIWKNRESYPWEVVMDDNDSRVDPAVQSLLSPGWKDKVFLVLLPTPLLAGGELRSAAAIGATGQIVLINTARYASPGSRLYVPTNSQRPQGCGAYDASVSVIRDRIAIVGGGCRNTFMDLYDPVADSWSSVNTGISREHSNTVLLPDGQVLLLNGERTSPSVGNSRQPQLFNPVTLSMQNLVAEPAHDEETERPQRGEHVTSLLLSDGSILVGGGRSAPNHSLTDEKSLRRFYLPYHFAADRPSNVQVEQGASFTVDSFGGIQITFESTTPLRATRTNKFSTSGVVLMGLGISSHGMDNAQSYIPLSYSSESATEITVYNPEFEDNVVPGAYMLYLVNEDGVPSVGVPVTVHPRTGEYVRTVVYMTKQTEFGDTLYFRGGHDDSVRHKYDNTGFLPIYHANTINHDHSGDRTLDWFSNSKPEWTRPTFDKTSYEYTNRLFYSTNGFGVDMENKRSAHTWKLNFYTRQPNPSIGQPHPHPEYQDWFEIKAVLQRADGTLEWEGDVTHNTNNAGPSPPTTTINHWAKKGAVNYFSFDEDRAQIIELNEVGLRLEDLEGDASRANEKVVQDKSTDTFLTDVQVGVIASSFIGLAALGVVVWRKHSSTENDVIALNHVDEGRFNPEDI